MRQALKVSVLCVMVVFIITTFSLIGCKTTATETTAAATETTAAATETTAAAETTAAETVEKTTITFLDSRPLAERTSWFLEAIAAFEAKYPNITVEYNSVSYEDSTKKILAMAASNTLPDIIMANTVDIPVYAQGGFAIDLDPYFQSYEYKDSFIPLITNVFMQQKQRDLFKGLFIIPDGLYGIAEFYRTDWFKELGLTPAKTWDEHFANIAKLTDPSKNRYGYSFRGGQWGFESVNVYLMTVTQGQMYEKDGTSVYTRPEVIQAFKDYTDIYKKGYTPKDSIAWGYAEMVQGFTSGLCGILSQGNEIIPVAQKNMQEGTWGISPRPVAKDGENYNQAGFPSGYSISKNSKHPEEAWKFIAFLSSPENNIKYNIVNSNIPIVKEAQNDPTIMQGPQKVFVDMLSGTNYVIVPPFGFFPEVGEFSPSFADAEMQKYLMGQQSAEETMKHLGDFLTKSQQKYMKEHPEIPIPQPNFTTPLG